MTIEHVSRAAVCVTILFLLTISAHASKTIVAQWSFDEGEGSVIHDVSGNGHHGILKSGQWVKGVSGFGVALDGVTSFIEIPAEDELSGMSQLTIELWIKSADPIISQKSSLLNLWGKKNKIEGAYAISLQKDQSVTWTAHFASSIFPYVDINNTSFITGSLHQWHYIVGVFTGRSVRMYTDGMLSFEDSSQISSIRPIGDLPLLLGRDSQGNFFKGVIDEVRILRESFFSDDVATRYALFSNHAPRADGGADRGITKLNEPLILDGSGCWDQDGDELSYSWSLASKPAGSAAVVQNPVSQSPHFTPDISGTYLIICTVSDSSRATASDTVILSSQNNSLKPQALLSEKTVATYTKKTVTLDGSKSFDLRGEHLLWRWEIVKRPAESVANLDVSATAFTSFIPDVAGEYGVKLSVSNTSMASDPVYATIVVCDTADEIKDKLMALLNEINELPRTAFINKNCQAIISAIVGESILNLNAARLLWVFDKLLYNLSYPMDGCVNHGSPDSDDWIIDCEVQEKLYPTVIELYSTLGSKL